MTASTREYHQTHATAIIDELADFVRVPNNVFDPAQIQANAHHLQRLMEQRSIRTELWPTPSGHPLVFGELPAPGAARTILIYGHYDGVPVEREHWHSDPYEPVIRAGRLYGRSAADSKNGIVAVLTAIDALRAAGRGPGVDLKFLFDGAEELESPGLPECLAANRDRLTADCVITACGETHQSGLPTVQLGVRGMLMLDLTIYTTTVDMHSGHFGGFAPSAAFQLAQLLSGLKDDAGRIAIPGFYDEVTPLTPEERAALRAVPAVEEKVCRQYGIARPDGGGLRLQEVINLPTLNVRGMMAGFLGESARNIVPGRASAELDLRLVQGMEPERTYQTIAAYLTAQGYTLMDREPTAEELRAAGKVARLVRKAGFPATRTPLASPIAAYVVSAVRRAVGDELALLPTEGGSLPMYLFARIGLPLIGLPPSNFDCNQHTHDENLDLTYLFRSIEMFAAAFSGEG